MLPVQQFVRWEQARGERIGKEQRETRLINVACTVIYEQVRGGRARNNKWLPYPVTFMGKEKLCRGRKGVIASTDLQVIGHALVPYAKMIRRMIEPSPRRDALLDTIETLRQRLSTMKTPDGAGTSLAQVQLSHAELAVIDAAMTAFVENIARFVPKSAERDEIGRSCEALRVHVVSGCTALDASV